MTETIARGIRAEFGQLGAEQVARQLVEQQVAAAQRRAYVAWQAVGQGAVRALQGSERQERVLMAGQVATLAGGAQQGPGIPAHRAKLQPGGTNHLAEIGESDHAHAVTGGLQPAAEGHERLHVTARSEGQDSNAHRYPLGIPGYFWRTVARSPGMAAGWAATSASRIGRPSSRSPAENGRPDR